MLILFFIFKLILVKFRFNLKFHLGLISYCMIIYYQNIISYNSGILSLLINRNDDVILVIIFLFIILNIYYNYNTIIILLNTIKIYDDLKP